MKLANRMTPLLTLALAGCATSPVDESLVAKDAPSLPTVQASPEQYQGRQVRWGGTIAAVKNRAEETCLEIVASDLEGGGRPRGDEDSQGRFIACIDHFLDPVIYAKDRDVTVIGEVAGTQTGTIDEYRYRYPLVEADRIALWTPPVYYYDRWASYWSYPYWNYPYGPGPYWGRPYW